MYKYHIALTFETKTAIESALFSSLVEAYTGIIEDREWNINYDFWAERARDYTTAYKAIEEKDIAYRVFRYAYKYALEHARKRAK